MKAQELHNKQNKEEGIFVIDVRSHDELVHGMIKESIHIPLGDLSDAFDMDASEFLKKYGVEKPTKEKLIIVYCRTGARSRFAQMNLKGKGYTVENLEGGINEYACLDSSIEVY